MSIESGTFETLSPSRYISFTIPNLLFSEFSSYLHSRLLRLAVLDSPKPIQDDGPSLVATMLVPKGREEDWLFITELISSDYGVVGNEKPKKMWFYKSHDFVEFYDIGDHFPAAKLHPENLISLFTWENKSLSHVNNEIKPPLRVTIEQRIRCL